MAAYFLKNFFKNDEVFVVGSGPSLTNFDFSRLKGRKIIAVNRTILYTKPDLAVYVDRELSKFFLGEAPQCPVITSNFAGVPEKHYSVKVDLRNVPSPQENDFDRLYGFCSSLAVAISAALVANALRVYVLGLDLYGNYFFPGEKITGRSGPTERELENQRKFFLKFQSYNLSERVINLNLKSRVEVFKKQNIEEVL
jgi:hypothetical protein